MVAVSKYESPVHSLTVRCINKEPVLSLDDGTRLNLVPSLPAHWNQQIVSGSQVHSYQGPLGEVVIQEYQGREWSMRLTHFHFLNRTILKWHEDALLCLQFALKGSFTYVSSQTSTQLTSGSANSIRASNVKKEATFKKEERYALFQIFYATELVRQLFPAFPSRHPLLEEKAIPIEREWLDAIYQILDCPYDTDTRNFFYENRIRDLLLYATVRFGNAIRHTKIGEEEIRKIHEVDALILEDLRQWLHIPALAKKVHMSEFRLKIVFKQVIGVNLFERLRIARLERARLLLSQTNMQIKAIHREVGYKSLSGFEEAFKEKYGTGPSNYRAKYSTRP